MSDNPGSDKGVLRKSWKRNTEILSLRAEGHTAKLGRAIPIRVDCFVVPLPAGLLAMTSLRKIEPSS